MGAVKTTVRDARHGDRTSLYSLTSQFPTPTPCSHETFCTLLDSKLNDERACVIVAEHDERLIGYVSGSVRSAFYAAGATAWVDEIFVTADFRSRGVGAQLMAAFETWAVRHDAVLVALATRGAAAFYEQLGYVSKASYFKKYLTPESQEQR
jgi:GNAT superfamily N-acetyltransferase